MRVICVLIIMAFSHLCHAQSFKIKEFKANISDLSASTQQRTDTEGQPCGLIKVQTKVAGVEFGGNVIGNVENKINEYWVYLPKGTKEVVVMRPDYLPLTVHLAEYGIEAIESKTTYTMVLKEVNLNPEKCGVTIHVKPREAQVKIDDVVLKQNSSGDHKILLPKGEHLCRIDAPGYRSDIKTITTGKGVQDINVELESLMANISIISQTSGAEIFVDGESLGIGGWKGKMVPGKHVVEARQKGYVTTTNNLTLAEKEERTITIPKLAPIVGTLEVKSIPEGCKVYLDGEEKSPTPCVLNGVVYGNHRLIIKLDSCGLLREKNLDIQIDDEGRKDVQCDVVTNSEWKNHVNATNWFKKGCSHDYVILGGYNEDINKAKEWYDKIINIIDSLDVSFFTRNMTIPELQEIEDSFGPRATITIDNIPGEKMMEYYSSTHYYGDGSNQQEMKPDIDKAIAIANKVDDNQSAISVAILYAEKGDKEKATLWLNKAKNKEGINKIYWRIGRCFQLLKNKNEAIVWYKKAAEEGGEYSSYAKVELREMGVPGYEDY